MLGNRLSLLITSSLLGGLASAQFPPALEGVTVLDSHIEDGIRISYKEVFMLAHPPQTSNADNLQNDLCETTEGVRSYSGYVHLPAGALADLGVQNQTYEINTFFWFFESRKDPANAPLSIWMVRESITSRRCRLHFM